ncbi:10756_t:CDS:2, partial [Acaulospora colombiana]
WYRRGEVLSLGGLDAPHLGLEVVKIQVGLSEDTRSQRARLELSTNNRFKIDLQALQGRLLSGRCQDMSLMALKELDQRLCTHISVLWCGYERQCPLDAAMNLKIAIMKFQFFVTRVFRGALRAHLVGGEGGGGQLQQDPSSLQYYIVAASARSPGEDSAATSGHCDHIVPLSEPSSATLGSRNDHKKSTSAKDKGGLLRRIFSKPPTSIV